MNIKKIVSAVTAFALSATMFAGFSVQAATSVYTTDFATEITDNAIGTAYAGWGINGSNITLATDSNVLTSTSLNSNNNNYLSYQIDTIANVADKVYKIAYTGTTTTGTATSNNASETGVVQSESDTITWSTTGYTTQKTSGIGMTTSGTEYNVVIIVDNVSNKITWAVDGTVMATSATTVDVNRFLVRTGRGKADTFKNFTISKLDMPTMTLTAPTTMDIATESTTKTTTVTATLSEETAITAVSSSDTEVATVAFEGTAVTVTGVDIGEATITVTAAKNGETADVFETVTNTFDVAVENTEAAAATITVKYQDAEGNTLKADETVTDEIFVGKEYEATDAQKANFTYVKDEIEYTATLNAETVTTVTPASETAELVLVFDLTENTYATTITTAPYAQVVITGTSKSGEAVNTTVNSSAAGVATANLLASGDDYAVAVTKGGYTSANGTVAVSSASAATTVASTITGSELYYEDFNTAPAEGKYFSSSLNETSEVYAWGMSGSGTKVGAQTTDGTLILSSSNGGRATTKNFGTEINATDNYKVSFDLAASESSDFSVTETLAFADASGNVLFGLSYETENFALTAYNGTLGSSSNADTTSDTVEVGTGYANVKVECIVSNDKAILTLTPTSGEAKTVELDITSAQLAQMRAYAGKNMKFTIDNFVVENAPALTVSTAKPDDITTAPTTTTAQPVTEGVLGTAEEVDLTDVTTVYIKVENAATGVMPAIVVGEDTYAPTYKYEINSNGYFVYQFVGIDLTGATVTYTGAADVAL